MSKNTKKKKVIGLLIFMAVLVMDILGEVGLARLKASHGEFVPFSLRDSIGLRLVTVFLGAVCFLLPYEKLGVWVRKPILSREGKIIGMTETVCKALLWLLFLRTILRLILKHLPGLNAYTTASLLTIVITLYALYWMVALPLEGVPGVPLLLLYEAIMILVSGLSIYSLTNSGFILMFTFAGIEVGALIAILDSELAGKWRYVMGQLVSALVILFLNLSYCGKLGVLSTYFSADLTEEWSLLKSNRSLSFAEDFPWYYKDSHPLMWINTYLGGGAMLVVLIACAVLMGCVVFSRNVLGKERYVLLCAIAGLFFVIFVYSLAADLGYVPAAWLVPAISWRYYCGLGIVLRLFWKGNETNTDE